MARGTVVGEAAERSARSDARRMCSNLGGHFAGDHLAPGPDAAVTAAGGSCGPALVVRCCGRGFPGSPGVVIPSAPGARCDGWVRWCFVDLGRW